MAGRESDKGFSVGGASVERVASDTGAGSGVSEREIKEAFVLCDEKVIRPLLMTHSPRARDIDPNWTHRKDQTLIIFDWDDMLFPLTWASQMRSAVGERLTLVEVREQCPHATGSMSFQVVELLTLAQQLGEVLVLTSEPLPWVQATCSTLMPKLGATLKEIPVLHTMTNPKKSKLSAVDAMIERKSRAMAAAIAGACSSSHDNTLTNIVCVGFPRCDFAAIRKATSETTLLKSMKTLEGLSPITMVLQQTVLTRWLSHIVRADLNLDI